MQQRPFTVTGLDLSAYMVKDAARAIAFYREVLGLEPTTTYPNDAGAEYEFSDGTAFGLWNPGTTMSFQPASGVLFAVDDLDAAVAAIKTRNVPVLMEHETAVCWMAMIQDTEGNSVVLHKRKDAA